MIPKYLRNVVVDFLCQSIHRHCFYHWDWRDVTPDTDIYSLFCYDHLAFSDMINNVVDELNERYNIEIIVHDFGKTEAKYCDELTRFEDLYLYILESARAAFEEKAIISGEKKISFFKYLI